jgi:hypothetical protein
VTALVLGSSAKHSDWGYHRDGRLVLLNLSKPAEPQIAADVPAGAVPEGLVFSPDSQFVYAGNYIDKNVQIYRIENGKLVDTGTKLALPGQPASMRGPAR